MWITPATVPSIWLITQRTYPWCKITPTTLYQRLDFNGSSSHFSVLNDSGLTISRLMQFIKSVMESLLWHFVLLLCWYFDTLILWYFVDTLILWYFDILLILWYFDDFELCFNTLLKFESWVFCLTLVLLKFDSWG